ncbi:MAG: hypothetical protein WCE35_15825, partial [Bradyrhizobium sp.]
MGRRPAGGQIRRATAFHALSPCLALMVWGGTCAQAQMLTSDMLRPVRGGLIAPQDSPLRRTSEAGDKTFDGANDARLRGRDADTPA